MAEMLIDGAKLDACMTAEANAIRAKTGGSGQLTYDYENGKGFADEIANIQTGGGDSLPSSISAIDGGEFTLASRTVSTYQITHSLGVVPKCFVIWADGVDISTAANNTVIRGVFIVDESTNESVIRYLYQMGVYNHNFNSYARNVGANYSGYANADYISYNVSNVSYEANVTYKWIAWA